jgi:hypothetical protein
MYDLQQIASCDGLLIVWNEDGGWFKNRYKKLSNEKAYRKTKPYRSKAVCFLPPPPEPPEKPEAEIDSQDLVLRFSKDEDFDVATLKPFIDRLKPETMTIEKE